MMTIFLFSLAGIPSTIGFIGKFYVFTEAINAGFAALAILAIIATFVSVYYYFKLIAMMYFYPTKEECLVNDFNDKELLSKLVIQKTISGGYHFIYRCKDLKGNKNIYQLIANFLNYLQKRKKARNNQVKKEN